MTYLGVKMRINRNMLLKIAHDAVDKYVNDDRSIVAIYLQGSLLTDSPLIANTADIDLFFIHSDEVPVEREIVRVSDEVHLDISHHSHRVYRQPRELRVHPWLGPAMYGCKIMYDPQHFIDFIQASVRGQFNNPENVIGRVQRQAIHAREMWESFNDQPHPPDPQDASVYLRALEHVANAASGLSGQNLTERRFLAELLKRRSGEKNRVACRFFGIARGTQSGCRYHAYLATGVEAGLHCPGRRSSAHSIGPKSFAVLRTCHRFYVEQRSSSRCSVAALAYLDGHHLQPAGRIAIIVPHGRRPVSSWDY